MKFEDYEVSSIPKKGFFDELSQYWILRREKEFEEKMAIDFLEIGGPGVDGIGFGLRKGKKGIWAYYPNDDEFELKANTVEEFLEGYTNGSITV